MKTLLLSILAALMLVGCAGMGTSGDSGMRGANSIEQWNKDHHNDPSDTYFGA